MITRIVLALGTPGLERRIRTLLTQRSDAMVVPVRGRRHLWPRLAREEADLLVVSRGLIPEPVPRSIGTLREVPGAPEVIVLSEGEGNEDRARLLAAGCYGLLDTTLGDDLLGEALAALVQRRSDETTSQLDLPQTVGEPRLSDFVSRSPAMQAFLEIVYRVVASDTTLLIVGETGVGKERLAQAIHAEGARAIGPFVAVNCAAFAETLLESELFGHEAGAFTGATRARRGWFELAHHGTIFLDEVGDMPPHLQVKLLRVLQTREVLPLGSERPVHVDVRVMAATNRDLQEEVKAGKFRPDLYYRLGVVTLEVPALRDRKEDIPALVKRYIQYFRSRFATAVGSVAPEALEALCRYGWPGNIREMTNVIERAMLLCRGKEITPRELPEEITGHPGGRGDGALEAILGGDWTSRPLGEIRTRVVRELEVRYLTRLLEETGGHVGETARRSGMNPRNLFEKMRRYGLRKESFRRPRPQETTPRERAAGSR